MNTPVISAFPACGKTWMADVGSGWRCSDSDSSMFSWSAPGVRNPMFPMNYMDEIERLISGGVFDAVLTSSHKTVRKALRDRGIPFLYVLPDRALMDEWVGRCKARGSTDGFIRTLTSNWDAWTSDVRYASNIIRLGSGGHLADVVGGMDPVTLFGIHVDRDPTSRNGFIAVNGVGETVGSIDRATGAATIMDGWDGYGVGGVLSSAVEEAH